MSVVDTVARTPEPRAAPSPSRLGSFDRRAVAALTALVVAVALPFAFMGPGFIVDDWRFLARREFSGVFSAAPPWMFFRRPGSWVVVTLLHGLIGAHPLVIFAVLTSLNAAVVSALYLVARRFVSPPVALAVAAVWAILPNHTTLSYWPAVANATVALLLLIVGVGLLDARRWALAGAVLVASSLCYEATIVPAVVAILVVPAFRRELRLRPTLRLLAVMGVTALWMVLHPTYPLDRRYARPVAVLPAHFGSGITTSSTAGRVLALLALAGVAALAWRLRRRARLGQSEWLVIVGVALIPLGLAAFVKHHFGVVGIADRAYTVSAIGAALVWVGIAGMAWARSRLLAVVAGAVFVVLVVPANLDRQRAYSRAGDDALALVAYIQYRYGDDIPPVVVVGPTERRFDGIPSTVGIYHATRLLEYHLGRDDLKMRVSRSFTLFYSVPADRRVTWAQVDAYRAERE